MAANLPIIYNPHVLENLRVGVDQSVVADLCRAEDHCIVEDQSFFEDPPVLEDLRVAENLPPVVDASVTIDAPTPEYLRVVRDHCLIVNLCVVGNPAIAELAQVAL